MPRRVRWGALEDRSRERESNGIIHVLRFSRVDGDNSSWTSAIMKFDVTSIGLTVAPHGIFADRIELTVRVYSHIDRNRE